MNSKIRGVALIFIYLSLVFVNTNFISSVGLEDSVNTIEDKTEEINTQIQDISDGTKWDYLQKEWKNILLKNSIIAGIDGFFKKINFVFVFLFAENYYISFVLLIIVILWIFLLSQFGIIFKNYIPISPKISFISSLLVLILFSHLGIIRKIVEFFVYLVFYKESTSWQILTAFCLFLFLLFLGYLNNYVNKVLKAIKENDEKAKEKYNREILGKLVNSLIKD